MRENVLERLKNLNINYKIVEHTPVYTIDEMDELGDIFDGAKICKNLFVRDQKGKKHFLIVVPEEKRVPLADVSSKIGSTKLSFASEERLMKYLKLTPGAVTPLAVINDENSEVEVILDEELKNEKILGVHPCENTATILLTIQDLEKYINSCNNKYRYIKF